jgi:hypothetical protein
MAIECGKTSYPFRRIWRQQFRRDLVYESKYGPESACMINV